MSYEKENPFADFLMHRYINLTTFYSSGKGVPTKMNFAEKDGKLYVATGAESWKIKRIRGNPRATIQPCSPGPFGKARGPKMNVVVRILPKEEETTAKDLLDRRLNLIQRFFRRLESRGQEVVYLEISPV